MQVLPPLGGSAGVANAINENGDAVGLTGCVTLTFHRAFLWPMGMMTDLETLSELPMSVANGINNNGQVAGFYQDANGDDFSSVAWGGRTAY